MLLRRIKRLWVPLPDFQRAHCFCNLVKVSVWSWLIFFFIFPVLVIKSLASLYGHAVPQAFCSVCKISQSPRTATRIGCLHTDFLFSIHGCQAHEVFSHWRGYDSVNCVSPSALIVEIALMSYGALVELLQLFRKLNCP